MKLTEINFWKLTKKDLLEKILSDCVAKSKKSIYTVVDAASIARSRQEVFYEQYLLGAEIVLADGYYVYLAAKFLGVDVKEQITGFELTNDLIKLAVKHKLKIYFFGAEETVLIKLIDEIKLIGGADIVAGFRNGYFAERDISSIVENINRSNADILLMGISSPLREKFINQTCGLLNVSSIIPVGGVFDILGGKSRRAPQLMVNIKLEWFYRFIQEPRRMFVRVSVLYPIFVFMILKEKIFKSK